MSRPLKSVLPVAVLVKDVPMLNWLSSEPGAPPELLKIRSVKTPEEPEPAMVPHQRNIEMVLEVLAVQLSACWPPLISAGNEFPSAKSGGWLYTTTSATELAAGPVTPIKL